MPDLFKNSMKASLKKIQFVKLRVALALKVGNIAKNLKLEAKNTREHKKLWGKLCRFVNTKWFQVYTAISGVDDINYVPEDIFYAIIEPRLNNRGLALAYADKNSYEKYYSIKPFPGALIRNIHGIFLGSDYGLVPEKEILSYLKPAPKVLIKPSIESSQGRNIEIFTKNNSGLFYNSRGDCLGIEYIKKRYKEDYVIQEYIEQHPYFAQFNESSLNSVRIFTYRSVSNNRIIVLGTLLKFGKKGSIIDNQSGGGICLGIGENGSLHHFGTDLYGNKYHAFENGCRFSEAGKVHKIAEMKELAVKIASENYHFRLLGFDICVDKNNNPKVIEVNNNYLGINFHQMSGQPLFKAFTDEIIDYCARKG